MLHLPINLTVQILEVSRAASAASHWQKAKSVWCNLEWLVKEFQALATDSLGVVTLTFHLDAVATSKFPMLCPTSHAEPFVFKFVAQSLLPLFGLHVERFLGQEALAKRAWKAILDPGETMKAVSGHGLVVFEKCGTPGMEISRGNY